MDKRRLSKRDICSKFITSAQLGAGWKLQTQIAEVRTLIDGRNTIRGELIARAFTSADVTRTRLFEALLHVALWPVSETVRVREMEAAE